MQELTDEEIAALSRARRAADLVLSYGKHAVTALLTWGVGPQTAAGILAKMHMQDEDFYADLLKAKLKYIQTRPFWD
jgi:ATP-dependent Lhr-like helicase